MNAVPVTDLNPASWGEAKEPLYFRSGEHTLFGWLHRPDPGVRADTGLVICKPFGFESNSASRTVRAIAESAAGMGMPVLRFDYLGTGDSEDIDPGADQLQTWLQDILAAVGELQRRSGVERVCLLGFRLGALLATLAAARCDAISALVLLAPVLSGKRYLRELRTTQLAGLLGVRSEQSPAGVPGMGGKQRAAEPIEAGGYRVSRATVASLSQVELGALESPPALEMLVIDRSDLPVARAWKDALSALGARVQYEVLPGYVGLMRVPQHATVPREMVACVNDWLQRLRSDPAVPGRVGAQPLAAGTAGSPGTVLRLRAEGSTPDGSPMERPVRFGTDSELFGIVTEPAGGERRRRAVILLNTGADYHVGAHRTSVYLARRWGLRGYHVLRMDMAGLGDSDTRAGSPGDEVFPVAALDDIRAAVEFMRAHYKTQHVTLAGVCSGAYHALRAAVAALPVNGILMVNPLNFFWKEGTSLGSLQLSEIVNNPTVYRERVRSVSAWKRLLTGKVNVWRIALIYAQRPLLALESTVRDWARWLHIRLPRDLGTELQDVVARKIRVAFVFSAGEPGLELLRLQGGSTPKRLGEECRVRIIDDGDHTFSRTAAKALLESVLSEELSRQGEPVRPGRAAPTT